MAGYHVCILDLGHRWLSNWIWNRCPRQVSPASWIWPIGLSMVASFELVTCKDNTSNDPFSRCKSVQQFGYRWNWRSQNTVWQQVHNWTTISRRKELYTWYCVCVVKPSDKTHDTNDNVTTRPRAPSTQRTWTSTRELMHAWFHVRIVQ